MGSIPVNMRFVVDKVTMRQVSVFASQYHFTSAQYSSPICRTYQMDKQTKFGNLPKRNALSKIGAALDRKVLSFFLSAAIKEQRGPASKSNPGGAAA